ncbi:MAG: methionyl-tRNA formyltransferase [Clostridia bacterium]
MARISIENIRKLEKSRNSVHEKVETTYTIFKMDGEKYVQIDTYGRIGRENPEKISQSFQLDRSTALFLVHLLRAEFGI